jgi:hypothetical protein
VTALATPAATVATPAVTVAAIANGRISGHRNGEKYTRPWKPGPFAMAGATPMKRTITARSRVPNFLIARSSIPSSQIQV